MKKKTFLIVTIVLCIFAGISAFFAYLEHFVVFFEANTFEESTEKLHNPYQGWYRIYGYQLSDTQSIDLSSITNALPYDSDSKLALLEINLKNYSDCEISDTALLELDNIFSTWSKNKKQLIVRFLYDWNGENLETEPKNIDMILSHMTQVAKVVNRYADSIYILQGIFVGNCGEMNQSAYMDDISLTTLLEHWASVTDSSIYLAVRTPAHWRIAIKSLNSIQKQDAFSGSLASRLSLFNDGMLASGNDLGTYGDTPFSDTASFSDKFLRKDEIAFQKKLCAYVPNGGEVVLDNTYNDFENAILDLSDMHVSYLDYDYDDAVLDKWKASTYTMNNIFYGCNGYDYIETHMGYRYVIRSAKVTQKSLSVDIENVGFSNSYRPFTATICLQNKETAKTIELPIDTDTRFWNSNESTRLSIPLNIRSYGTGTYDLFLKLSDPVNGDIIAFANTINSSQNGYLLGSLSITK